MLEKIREYLRGTGGKVIAAAVILIALVTMVVVGRATFRELEDVRGVFSHMGKT